jgi:hypothetical protein
MPNGYIDLPERRLTRKKFPKPRGINLEPTEHLLEKDRFFRPIGLALEKEYGKRISEMEFIRKAQTATPAHAIDITSLGVAEQAWRINKRINKQIKEETKKHLR